MCVAYDLTSLQREAEHRESLATTIRVLRASESEQTLEIVCFITSVKGISRAHGILICRGN